ALHGGFCIAALEDGGVRVHRLGWPERWRAVVFVPDEVSPTNEARRLVPRRPTREDAVFNLGRVAEWVLACTKRDRSLLRSAMDDRLHQPGRARAYPYLDDTIAAAEQAGALGAALSGAGGSVIAGSMIAGGVIGATVFGPLVANAANSGSNTQLTAASASPSASAGTFKSNEDAAHEANESAAVEAQENAGQRPGGGSGKFTPNEDPAHEAGESAAREAQENAGQRPTVP